VWEESWSGGGRADLRDVQRFACERGEDEPRSEGFVSGEFQELGGRRCRHFGGLRNVCFVDR